MRFLSHTNKPMYFTLAAVIEVILQVVTTLLWLPDCLFILYGRNSGFYDVSWGNINTSNIDFLN